MTLTEKISQELKNQGFMLAGTGIYENLAGLIENSVLYSNAFGYSKWIEQTTAGSKVKKIVFNLTTNTK